MSGKEREREREREQKREVCEVFIDAPKMSDGSEPVETASICNTLAPHYLELNFNCDYNL